jgi:hypothetical protein
MVNWPLELFSLEEKAALVAWVAFSFVASNRVSLQIGQRFLPYRTVSVDAPNDAS